MKWHKETQNRLQTPRTRERTVQRPTHPVAGAALAALLLATSAALPAMAASVSYPALVLTNQPIGYWQLNDTADPSTGTAVVLDSSTYSLNGDYATNAMDGFNKIFGPRPTDFPGFSATEWALGGTSNVLQSFATVPLGSLSTNEVTLTAWVYLNGPQAAWTGFFESRDTTGLQGGLGMNAGGMLVYTWNNNNADTYNFASGLTIPLNQWSFVAVAVAPTEATLYLDYVDTNGVTTLLTAVNAIAHTPDAFGTNWQIGADECCGDGLRTLNGSIAQVAAFERTMTGSEINALFLAGLGITQVAPAVTQSPAPLTVYDGRLVSLTAAASGLPAPTYQWQAGATASGPFTNLLDGPTIAGSATASLTLSNVTAANAIDYRVVVTNIVGGATSSVAALTVLPAPTLSGYANAVYTNGPLAYWRLNESYTETNALDLMSDFMGTYGPTALWGPDAPGGPVYGPISPAFPGFETTNTAVNTAGTGSTTSSWVTVPTPGLTTNTVTFLAWIYPILVQADYTGLFMTRAATQAGIGFGGTAHLGYTWNGNNADTYNFESGLNPPLNQWSMVAVVIEPTMATLYMCTGDTVTNSFNLIAHDVEAWGGPATIGNDTGGSGRVFNGTIDEMAIFEKALSFDQINSLYDAAIGKTQAVAPWFVVQPTSTARYAGLTATLTSMATGSSPLSYQWYQGSVALTDGGNISGSKTATLTLSNMGATNAGNYKLVVTNPGGSATSKVVAVTVAPRTSSTYEAAVLSLNPLAYWRLNETTDPSTGTAVAWDYVGGYDGTYGTNSLDGFTGVAGPRPVNGFSIFETNNTALETTAGEDTSAVTAPQPPLNSNTATFTFWVNPNGAQADWTGLFMNRSTDGEGVGMGGAGNTNAGMLTYTWNGNSAATYGFVSGLTIPQNQWSMVAVAIAPTQAILYLLNTNGVQTATNAIPQTVEAWGGTASIGIDPGFTNGRDLNGMIDEVAMFNYTLTPSEVKNLYDGVVSVPRPSLTIGPAAGGKLSISWSGPGTLQSTPALQPGGSVWTTVGTNNPTLFTPTGKAQFYRLLLP